MGGLTMKKCSICEEEMPKVYEICGNCHGHLEEEMRHIKEMEEEN